MTQRRTLLQAGAALALSSSLPAHSAAPFQMAYFETYSPLSFRQGSALQGILLDVIEEILYKRMRVDVDHKGYPWNRAQLMVQNGEADAICTIATPERLEYAVAAEEPVVSPRRRVFVRASHPMLAQIRQIKDLDELRQLNLTVVSYAGNGWAKANLVDFKVEQGIDFESALKMLIARRGDVFIDNSFTMQYSLQRLPGGNEILMMPANLDQSHFQLLVSKKSTHLGLLPAFDAALRQFKRTPQYTRIYQQYGVQP
jgi:polar amino acid transport system substrate-binding protein